MNQYQEKIIFDQLSGQLEDEAEFNRLMEDQEFREIYNECKVIYEAGKQYELKQSFRKAAAWQIISQRTLLTKRPTRHLIRYAGYAATILIALGVTWWFVAPEPEIETITEFVTLHHIQAGYTNATLILGDGTSIDLSETDVRQLQERDGTAILKDKETGILSYHDNSISSATPSVINKIQTPPGCEYRFELSDGTVVRINAGSELTFPTRFTGSERRMQLRGEAYFEVAHQKDMPFIVETMGMKIKVLGTHFNVRAYDEDQELQTTLTQGKVEVQAAGQTRILVPGEQSSYHKSTAILDKRVVNTTPYLAWLNGRFSFRDESLSDILVTLSRWYKVDFQYADESLKGIRFTGDLKRYAHITDILQFIEKLSDVKFKPGKEVLIVSHK